MCVVNSLLHRMGSGDGTQVFRPDKKASVFTVKCVTSPQTGCCFQSFTLELFVYMCAHLFYLYLYILIVRMCVSVGVRSMPEGVQKGVSDSLELELQMLSCLDTKLGSSGRAVSARN